MSLRIPLLLSFSLLLLGCQSLGPRVTRVINSYDYRALAESPAPTAIGKVQIGQVFNRTKYSDPNRFAEWGFFNEPVTDVVRNILEIQLKNNRLAVSDSDVSIDVEVFNLVYDLRPTTIKFIVRGGEMVLFEKEYKIGNGIMFNYDFKGQIYQIRDCINLFIHDLVIQLALPESKP